MQAIMPYPAQVCSTMENVNGNGAVKMLKCLNADQGSLEKKEDTGILNPQDLQNMEAVTRETGSGTTATDNQASKRQKKNNIPTSGDVLSRCDNTQDKAVAKEVLSISNVSEAVSVEKVPQGGHMKDAYGKTALKANTDLIVNEVGIKKKLIGPELQFRSPTLGDILNPRYLELVEASEAIRRPNELSNYKFQHKLLVQLGSGKAEPGRNCIQDVVNGEKRPSAIANVESTMLKSIVCPQVGSSQMGSTEIVEPKVNKTTEKKLIVLDVNGLLARIKKDTTSYARPYLNDFLQFCFERFHVGVWSSRNKERLDEVVHRLFGNLMADLLFIWDFSQLVKGTKYLGKIWDKDGPNNAWEKGTFHESNTLLIDDSPHKALRNPEYTAIFPSSYDHRDQNSDRDSLLAPGGKLQTYLEGWAAADDGRAYVEQHPFGNKLAIYKKRQRAISEQRMLQKR